MSRAARNVRARRAILNADTICRAELTSVTAEGKPVVVYDGCTEAFVVSSVVHAAEGIDPATLIGRCVLVSVHNNDPSSGVIVGFVGDSISGTVSHARQARDVAKSASPEEPGCTEIVNDKGITLRCGKGKIQITRAGAVIIQGMKVTSKAMSTNKIRGASVLVN